MKKKIILKSFRLGLVPCANILMFPLPLPHTHVPVSARGTLRIIERLLMRQLFRRWRTNTVRRIGGRGRRRCAIGDCRAFAHRSFRHCGDSCYALAEHLVGGCTCKKHFGARYCRGVTCRCKTAWRTGDRTKCWKCAKARDKKMRWGL